MIHSKKTKLAALSLCLLVAAPLIDVASPLAGATPTLGGVADGKTAILTPQGTWIVPPPGAPLAIVADTPNVTTETGGAPWGVESVAEPSASSGASAMGVSACTRYRAGWYETNDWYIHGGHAGIRPANLPAVTTNYCAGTGMGYTAGVAFGGENSWIQAGLVTFTGELSAKWMCQSNVNGALTTKYGPANAYGNGATVYTWFARDSGGVWRTYRYESGAYSVELGCTISRGSTNGEPLQAFGEIQGATSTSAPMGPWTMLDLRYLDTSGVWRVPTQLQAQYPGGTPCPPYGAGTVSSGAFVAGSGKACTTGTSSYP